MGVTPERARAERQRLAAEAAEAQAAAAAAAARVQRLEAALAFEVRTGAGCWLARQRQG